VPIMRIAYKARKNDFCFLTNASGTLLSGLNSLAQGVTSRLMERLLARHINRIRAWTGAPTQMCVVVPNAQRVVLSMPARIDNDLGADITKWYEHIPTAVEHPDRPAPCIADYCNYPTTASCKCNKVGIAVQANWLNQLLLLDGWSCEEGSE